jgi:hypothetical protein
MILASIVFLSCVVLVDETWLPRFCNQAVIKEKSTALSQIIKIDICRSSLAEYSHQPSGTFPPSTGSEQTLSIIFQVQTIGEALEDLIDSYSQTSFFSEAETDVKPSLLRWVRTNDGRPDELHRALYTDLEDSVGDYGDIVKDRFRDDIDFAKWIYGHTVRMLRKAIDNVNAQDKDARRCFFFANWFHGVPLLDRWFTRLLPSKVLLEESVRFYAGIDQGVKLFDPIAGSLLKDLERLTVRLNLARQALRLRDDEALVADVGQHLQELSRLSVILHTIRKQRAELRDDYLSLLEMVKRHRCLEVSEHYRPLFKLELANLQASVDAVQDRWRDVAGLWRYPKRRPVVVGPGKELMLFDDYS